MTDELTSQSSDVNISSIANATTAETSTGRLAGHVSLTNPVIMRVTIIYILAVFNLGGNGFTLITIRLTPRLWTKTNFILASMLAADLMTGFFTFWYAPFLIAVYIFNNPCHYNVANAVVKALLMTLGYVSTYHLILIPVERYIAIVYPLQYETKFTDRTLKWSISVIWVTGIISGMSYALWVINADLRKCDLIPVQYHLIVIILLYIPVCTTMFTCYGKILAIAWRQHQLIEPTNANPAAGPSVQEIAVNTLPPSQNNKDNNTEDPKHNALATVGPPATSAMTSDTTSEELAQQQRQKIKSRRREFKAVKLTGAIVCTFVILWFPSAVGIILGSAGYNPVVVNYIHLAGGAIGVINYSFSWAIYAAVSRKYRRAYRQVLIRIGCCCCKNITIQADSSLTV